MPNGSSRKKINLALQGGGAYGAFTWGVLDHVLEDGRLEIEGIAGASAGAINAVMLADDSPAAGPTRRVHASRTSGAQQASAATCPTRSAKRLIDCSGSFRLKTGRWRSGLRQCPAIYGPSISIRSTSIR